MDSSVGKYGVSQPGDQDASEAAQVPSTRNQRRCLSAVSVSPQCGMRGPSIFPPKVRVGSAVNSPSEDHFSNQEFALFLTLPLLKIYTACFLNNSELIWVSVNDGKGQEHIQIQVL